MDFWVHEFVVSLFMAAPTLYTRWHGLSALATEAWITETNIVEESGIHY